jgi:hypothetical protein
MDFTPEEKQVFSKMGKKSRKNFFANMSQDEKKAYMKYVRNCGAKKKNTT